MVSSLSSSSSSLSFCSVFLVSLATCPLLSVAHIIHSFPFFAVVRFLLQPSNFFVCQLCIPCVGRMNLWGGCCWCFRFAFLCTLVAHCILLLHLCLRWVRFLLLLLRSRLALSHYQVLPPLSVFGAGVLYCVCANSHIHCVGIMCFLYAWYVYFPLFYPIDCFLLFSTLLKSSMFMVIIRSRWFSALSYIFVGVRFPAAYALVGFFVYFPYLRFLSCWLPRLAPLLLWSSPFYHCVVVLSIFRFFVSFGRCFLCSHLFWPLLLRSCSFGGVWGGA